MELVRAGVRVALMLSWTLFINSVSIPLYENLLWYQYHQGRFTDGETETQRGGTWNSVPSSLLHLVWAVAVKRLKRTVAQPGPSRLRFILFTLRKQMGVWQPDAPRLQMGGRGRSPGWRASYSAASTGPQQLDAGAFFMPWSNKWL